MHPGPIAPNGGCAVRSAQIPEFGREEDVLTAACLAEPVADELLVGVWAVDVGGVLQVIGQS